MCYFLYCLIHKIIENVFISFNTLFISVSSIGMMVRVFAPEIWVQSQVMSNQRLKKCYLILFTNPSARAGYDTRSIFKAEEPSLPYYLPIAGERIIGFIPFRKVLVLCEMQSVSSRIWTRVAVSISYDNNDYTMGTSKKCYLMPPCLTLSNIR